MAAMSAAPHRPAHRFRSWLLRRELGNNLLLIAAFLIAARLVGALREVVIARQFGVGELVDAYVLLFALVTFVPILWSNTLQSVVVPQLAELAPKERGRFTAELAGASLILGALLSLLLLLLAPALVTTLSADLSPLGVQYARSFGVGLAPIAGIGLYISLLTALLVASERRSASLIEALPPLALIIALLLNPTAAGLIVGSLIGIVAHAIAAVVLVVQSGVWQWPRLNLSSRAWTAFWKAAGLMLFVFLLAGMTYPIDMGIALALEEGAASRFGYAYRILAFLLALATITIGRAMLPAFVRAPHLALKLTFRWTPIAIAVGALIAIGLGTFAEPIVRVLFERGAFTADDTAAVAALLKTGLWQLPPYFGGIVLLQLVMSLKRYELMLWPSLIMAVIKVAGSLLLIPYVHLDALMLSSTASYAAMLALYAVVVARRIVPDAREGARSDTQPDDSAARQ